MVGKTLRAASQQSDADEPMLSVILDEFAPFAYPGFTQVLPKLARGARVSFLFSFPEHAPVAACEPGVRRRGFVRARNER